MKRLYKASEWQSGSGQWYVNDVQDVTSIASQWWIPTKILEITPVEFLDLLINNFHAQHVHYDLEYDVLIYSFATQAEARKYKNWINKKAREKQFMIESKK